MFIIIIGTRASGKATLQDYLVRHKGFKRLRLKLDKIENQINTHGSFIKNGSETPTTTSSPSLKFIDTDTLDPLEQEVIFSSDQSVSLLDTPESFLSMNSSTSATFAFNSPPPPPRSNVSVFTDPKELLLHVTQRWRQNYVTEDITTISVLEPFLKRPFVLLVSVDAPMLDRFRRHSRIYGETPLERFVADDDKVSFGPSSDKITSSYLFTSHHLCHVNIINNFQTIPELHSYLDDLNLLNFDRLRPGWDSYFMKLASLASHRSNCMKRRVGAIVVRNHVVVATGYNGTPRGILNCNEGGCKRCNEPRANPIEGFEECLCIHAEENALLECGRERVGKGAVLYCNTCPCLKCTIKIVQTGVAEVVYNFSYKMDASSARVFAEAGIKLRQYSPPK